MTFTEQLESLNACYEAIEWVDGRSLRTCWQVADRGDWMLWLAGTVGVDRKLLVLAACDCAEQALKHVREGEDRPAKAIQTARDWCEGKAPLDEARKASDAAWAAWASDGAWAAWASEASRAAGASAWAAEAVWAAEAAAEAAEEAEAASLKHSAKLVRKRIPVELIEEKLNDLR